jgi:hypothetical protein
VVVTLEETPVLVGARHPIPWTGGRTRICCGFAIALALGTIVDGLDHAPLSRTTTG